MLSFKPTFSLSTFTFIKRLLGSSSLSAIRVVSSAYLRLLIEEKTKMKRKVVAMEAEVGKMKPQAKEHLKTGEAGRDKKQDLP